MTLLYSVFIFLSLSGIAVWYFTLHQEGYSGSLDAKDRKLVIFDFDGTLCDSLQIVMNEFNAIAKGSGLEPISDPNEIWNSSMRHVLEAHGVTWWKLPILKYKLVKAIAPHVSDMKAPVGIREALIKLKNKGYTLGILTSNSHENTLKFINKQNLEYFSFIYYGSSIFGKTRLLEKIKSEAKASVIFYVGDESRDMEAAREADIPSIAVTWGYHSENVLSRYHPTYIVQSPAELIEILTGSKEAGG